MSYSELLRIIRWNCYGFIIAVLIVSCWPAKADGIQEMLMGPHLEETSTCSFIIPKADYEGTIEGDTEGLYALYIHLLSERCGFPPPMIYVPGHPKFYWDQPPLLPPTPPSPVPLSTSFMFLFMAVVALFGVAFFKMVASRDGL